MRIMMHQTGSVLQLDINLFETFLALSLSALHQSLVVPVMTSFNPSAHRLAGSNSAEAGGLILKGAKSKNTSDSDPIFKRPTTSLLGLDRLARRKREEREAEAANFPEKKARKDEDCDRYDSDVMISFGKSSRSREGVGERQYRGVLVETPSHTGGVNEEALQRMQSRLAGHDQKSHSVYASTSRKKDRESDSRRDRWVWWGSWVWSVLAG